MTSSEPARTAARRTRSTILASPVVVSAALIGVLGHQSLAASTSSAHRGAPGEADGAVPDGVTVSGVRPRHIGDDHTPGTTLRRRDHVYRIAVRVLAVILLPAALPVAPRRSRLVACRWALSARFPAECLAGLAPAARAAFEAARTEALWRDGELIGLTSGHRDARQQARLFAEAVRRAGSPELARRWVLPPEESRHVSGTALDVRPTEGARWLERHGQRYRLYRVYDNEWWHFEYRPEAVDAGCPPMYADATQDPRMRR